jgi:hypothetical protein
MYPQCHFKAVKDTVRHYASRLPELDQEKICLCLDILKFSMGNTSVDPDPDCRGLTIGRFESAFLADLEGTYLFDKLHHLMERHVRFIGTFCDDEIIIFLGQRSNEWLHNLLRIFHGEVDRLLGTVNIQFTMEIWRPSTLLLDSEVSISGIRIFQCISINGNMSFPYLDI